MTRTMQRNGCIWGCPPETVNRSATSLLCDVTSEMTSLNVFRWAALRVERSVTIAETYAGVLKKNLLATAADLRQLSNDSWRTLGEQIPLLLTDSAQKVLASGVPSLALRPPGTVDLIV